MITHSRNEESIHEKRSEKSFARARKLNLGTRVRSSDRNPSSCPNMFWAIRDQAPDGEAENATWLCSTWRSTAKLRGCDVVQLRLDDVAPNGYVIERAIIRQQKTGHPVKFELTEQTRSSVDEYLRAASRDPQVLAVSRSRCACEAFDYKAICSPLRPMARGRWS